LFSEETLSEDSLGTSSTGSDDPISSLLKEAAGMQIGGSTAGGRSMLANSFGLAPTPPPANNGMMSGWPQLPVVEDSTTDINKLVKCPLCRENFSDPRVLACFHSFCKSNHHQHFVILLSLLGKGCLEKQLSQNDRIICPQCLGETQISASLGIDGLLSDYGLQNAVNQTVQAAAVAEEKKDASKSPSPGGENVSEIPPAICSGCKSGEKANAYCVNCTSPLCVQCTNAHKYMHCFEGHRLEELPLKSNNKMATDKEQCNCLEHRFVSRDLGIDCCF
jgi:hypothetical protein